MEQYASQIHYPTIVDRHNSNNDPSITGLMPSTQTAENTPRSSKKQDASRKHWTYERLRLRMRRHTSSAPWGCSLYRWRTKTPDSPCPTAPRMSAVS